MRHATTSLRTAASGLRVVHGGRHADLKDAKATIGRIGDLSPQRHEHISPCPHRALALCDNAAAICIFLCIAQCAAVSLGGVPCGVQN
jgi:hypothetical protein